ncbi:hypothetical protein EC973_007580 [Apophysomyces ossiformis]|uniref:F-box domain-containing protein n=1 Tax=Apophysomyces ossiformis TaxID=679940 RepID=A0A8H7BTR2_9FUNG|nr:hypothetical protein EC973_007580 [Apophysomyces ossiformis]
MTKKDTFLIAPFENLEIRACAECLPAEVLENIGNRLSQRTLTILVRVCRSWNAALTPLLYSSAEINGPEQFNSLIRTLTITAPHKRLGHSTRTLYVYDTLSDKEFHCLPDIFPFIVDAPRYISPAREIFFCLNRWKFLRSISLNLRQISPQQQFFHIGSFGEQLKELTVYVDTLSPWIELICKFPSLINLTITGEHNAASFDELEKLQNGLPKLESLVLYYLPVRGEVPLHIVPSHSLRVLKFCPAEARSWIEYVSRKYTDLEELYFSGTIHWETEGLNYAPLAKSCSRLKKFNTYSDSPVYFHILDVLVSVGAPLTYLRLPLSEPNNGGKYLDCFQKTLSCIHARSLKRSVMLSFLSALKVYTSLTALVIWGTTDLAIDSILSSAKALQSLELKASIISVLGNNGLTASRQLRRLELSAHIIDNQVFSYLTHYHPGLVDLSVMYNGHSFGSPLKYSAFTYSPFTHSHFIYYPHPGLRMLNVFHDCKCFFRVLQSSVAERATKFCWRATSDATQDVRWYKWRKEEMEQKEDEVPELQRLKAFQVDDITNHFEYGGDDLVSTEPGEIDIQHKKVHDAFNRPILFIQCHYVDDMLLNNDNCYATTES